MLPKICHLRCISGPTLGLGLQSRFREGESWPPFVSWFYLGLGFLQGETIWYVLTGGPCYTFLVTRPHKERTLDNPRDICF